MRYANTSGYKYTVAEGFSVYLPSFFDVDLETRHFWIYDGKLTVCSGYAWDGASGPTWDTDDTLTPSLVHDVLYQAIRSGILPENRRIDADIEFYRMMRERASGFLGHLRAFYFFAGVRAFGWLSVRPKHDGEAQYMVLTAP